MSELPDEIIDGLDDKLEQIRWLSLEEATTILLTLIQESNRKARIDELLEIPHDPNFLVEYIEDRIEQLEEQLEGK